MSSTVSLKIRVGTTPLPVPEVTVKALSGVTMKTNTTRTVKPEVVVSLAGVPAEMDYRLTVSSSNPGVASADVAADGKSILMAARALGTSEITVTASSRNSAGTGTSAPVTFTLTVSDKKGSGKKGGGGCDAGVGGLALALAALFLLRRKAG